MATKANTRRQLFLLTSISVFVLVLGLFTVFRTPRRVADVNQVLGATPPPFTACATQYGNCLDYNGMCRSYASSCDIAKYCAQPFTACTGKTQTPTPTPSASPSGSIAGIGYFQLSQPCGAGSYKSITFACTGATNIQTLTNGSCFPGMTSLEKAISICKSTGVPTP